PHPAREYRVWLPVEIDRYGKESILRNEITNLAGEGDPGDVVQHLHDRRITLRAEGCNQPEQVRDGEERRAAGNAANEAIAEYRRVMRHPFHLHGNQRQEWHESNGEPVKHDHAVADAREIVVVKVEGGDLIRAQGG